MLAREWGRKRIGESMAAEHAGGVGWARLSAFHPSMPPPPPWMACSSPILPYRHPSNHALFTFLHGLVVPGLPC